MRRERRASLSERAPSKRRTATVRNSLAKPPILLSTRCAYCCTLLCLACGARRMVIRLLRRKRTAAAAATVMTAAQMTTKTRTRQRAAAPAPMRPPAALQPIRNRSSTASLRTQLSRSQLPLLSTLPRSTTHVSFRVGCSFVFQVYLLARSSLQFC